MAIKQNQSQPEVKPTIGTGAEKQSQEYFDLHSCVELLDVKSLLIIVKPTFNWSIMAIFN